MKPITYGGSWHDLSKGLTPTLISAMHMTRLYTGRHRYQHPAWVVDYAVNTAGRVRVGSRSRPWRPRQPRTLHLYPPNTIYWEDYPKDAKTLCDFTFVFFQGGEAVGLDKLIDPRTGYVRFLDPEGLAGPFPDEIAIIGQKSGDAGFWQAQAELCKLIDLLLKSDPTEEVDTRRIGHFAPATQASHLVRETDEYLDQNLAGPVLLADLARHLHISVSSLSHRYQAETGETPMSRLTRLRIDLAKILILSGQKLDAIVPVTGFSDMPHLSRTFKRLEGVSPREYMRALRAPRLLPSQPFASDRK